MDKMIIEDEYFSALTDTRRRMLERCVDSLIKMEADSEEKLRRLMALIESFEKDVRLDCGYRIIKMLKGERQRG